MAVRCPVPHPGDWPVVRLGDIASKIGSGATPAGGEDSYLRARSRFALVRSQNVFDRRFDSTGLAFISDEQAERLKGVFLQPGDLLLNITGDGVTFSRACAVPIEILPACVNQHVAIVRVSNAIAEPGYVLAYLTHPAVKSYIESFNAGGSRRAITKGHIESFELPLPPLPEQRAIARTLGTLDDKIELNRRKSETLEAIARALFKSWFVDFDPVHAKAEGQHPGLPKPLGGLFPDSFEDSELGEIPKGWWVHDTYRIADVIYGAPFKSTLFNEDRLGRPLIRIRDLTTHDPSVFTPEDHPRGYLVQPGDLIVGMDGEFRAHLWRGPEAWLNQRLCCFKSKSGVPRAFVHYSIESLLDFFERSKTGTTVIHLGKSDIDTFRMLVPPAPLLEGFGAVVEPLDASIVVTAQQSRTLAALRDTLLPKLISGELRVKDAMRMAGLAEA